MTAGQLLAVGGRWRDGLVAAQGDARAGEATLFALIGRGAGSTPAGDDVAIGALAYAWATQGEKAPSSQRCVFSSTSLLR